MDLQFTEKIFALFGMGNRLRCKCKEILISYLVQVLRVAAAQRSGQKEPLPRHNEKRTRESTTAEYSSDAKIVGASSLELASHNCITSIMPTKRLPRELLAYILQAYVDLDLSPFVLALVCHEWRSITLQTRTLWRYILVVDTVRGLR
ncbi:hypothetical protein FRC18_000209, partial [Serendipita sp. 400]